MSELYTVVVEPFAPPVLLGTAAQIVYTGATVRTTAFGKETVETYEIANGQNAAARAFMDDQLALETCINAERKKVRGDNTIIEITWAYDVDDTEWEAGSDAALWDFDIIDTSQPLMSHPYFGRNTILTGSDPADLMREMGACDQAVCTGKAYKLPDPNRPESASVSELVKTIMGRYAGLRFSGVDEWNPVMVVLSRRYRIFPSQVSGDYSWDDIFKDLHRVVPLSDYSVPDHITTAISGLEVWSYSASGDPTPSTSSADFVWVKQKPQVKLSGRNGNGPCDVTDYLIGMQQASTVIYPPLTGRGFDPIYNIGT